MINELWLIAGQIGLVAAFGVVGALYQRGSFRPNWFAGALLLYIFYEILLTNGLYSLPNLAPEAAWNWQGKLLALSGMLLVAASAKFGFDRIGVTLRQKPGYQPAMWVLIFLSMVIFYFAITTGDGPDDLETVLFQWTMPGLDEEVFYRGVLLLAMNEAFRPRRMILGAPIGYGGILTAVLFGIAHALNFGADGYSFDAMTFAVTGIPSLILLWMREKTGSLLIPVLAHNVANGAFTLF